ncbi:MAG TPA: hypothetical protein VN633_12970 [Bryobacteraceae bacterium]|nr:hypothetical protein [Bryobacteraceae bacterium]
MFDIDREHPEFTRHKDMWQCYRDLYVGGEQLKANAGAYLTRRQKEPLDVYSERLYRVFYENYIGSIVDWYAATLFRREPVLTFNGESESGRNFLNVFCDDCDLRGTDVSEFFRRCFMDTLVAGASHILLDFPRLDRQAVNRAEEDAAGLSRAFLVRYTAEELINWSNDENGQYEWVVLRRKQRRQTKVESSEIVDETYWYYFDKQQFRIYRREQHADKKAPVELISEGPHALAKLNRVPLFTMRVSHGLWLMNKAGSLQLEHFNKSNALSWAITMGLFAMPVIYSERNWNQIVGESYYIQLGPQDRFGWTEPDGRVYQIAADNLDRLRDEIYRVCYMSQAAGNGVLTKPESGLAKQRDFVITQEVLRAYGDMVKDTIRRILDIVCAAREDDVTSSVSGMDEFDIGDFAAELADAQTLLNLGIASPTMKQQVYQKLAFKYLCDTRQEIKDRIAREIASQFQENEGSGLN